MLSSAGCDPILATERDHRLSSDEPDARNREGKLGPLQVVGSVLAAALGVQSSKNRERDFKRGNLGIFIAAGIIFTLLFITTVATVVTLVIGASGP